MRVLILGSEGFIGSNAVTYFEKQGFEVYKADIILKDEPHYQVINPEQPDFASLFTQGQFDICINATGAANVQFSFNHPALDYSLNVANVYYLLNALRQYNPACRFINFSSAAVYGNPQQLPIHEKSKLHPLSPYGWHKLYSEQVCREFAQYFGLHTISLRVFSAYGEGLKKQLFWDVYQKILNSSNNSIEVFGTGKESRDFIYIQDLLQAVNCVINQASFGGEAINVACGQEVSIEKAIDTLVTQINPGLQVKFTGKEKKGDPLNWVADIGNLQSMGFTPSYNLEDGLKRTLTWMKKIS